MFRENVLVKDDVIDRISKTMVPVAMDYEIVQKNASPEARFVNRLVGSEGHTAGVYIFSPDGKKLGSGVSFGNMRVKTLRMIAASLEKFGPVEPRKFEAIDLNPYRGIGVRPDGSVRLAEYVRQRDRLKIKSPVISSVRLSAKEFQAFAPRSATSGKVWTVPESVAKKLCRVASPMCYQHAPQPDWVKAVTLKAKVGTISNGLMKVSYQGTMSTQRVLRGRAFSAQEVTLNGEGVYDLSERKMRSLLIVGSGTMRWLQGSTKPLAFDALIEWESQAPEK